MANKERRQYSREFKLEAALTLPLLLDRFRMASSGYCHGSLLQEDHRMVYQGRHEEKPCDRSP